MKKDKKENGNVTQGKNKGKVTKFICIVIVAVVVLGMMGCSVLGNSQTAALVTTTTAFRGDLQESISTSGMVSSEEQKVIFADTSGKVAQVNVATGDVVSKGDVLVAFDMEDAEIAFEQASLQQNKSTLVYEGAVADSAKSQAKVNEANTNLKVLEQQLADWKANLKNLQEELSESQRETTNALLKENYDLSSESADVQEALAVLDKSAPDYAEKYAQLQEQMDDIGEEIARNQYIQQTAGTSDYVAEMQEQIAQVQEEIAEFEAYKMEMESQKAAHEDRIMDANDRAQYQVDNRLAEISFQTAQKDYHAAKQGVVAEFNGIVMECSVVQGAMVSEGMQLLTLADSGNIKISFSASKHDVAKLSEGQNAKITISGNEYEGKVAKINRMATLNASNTPMVGVEVHITNPDDKIILGMDAKLEIFTGKTENALLIPVEVINADKEGDFLYVVENGIVVRKPIVCGISSDTYTEVLEGITEADQIILSSLTGFEEGMAVTVMPDTGAVMPTE